MGTVPYTYLIGWKHLDTWYYGVRFKRNCNPSDLWVTYFTSSNHVSNFVKFNGPPDVIEIRKIFTNAKSARLWEHTVLRRLDVRHDSRFLNQTNGDGQFFNTGHTDATKKKLSEKHTGKVLSEETKKKLSEYNKGKKTGDKNPMFGKQHTEESKRKIGDASRGKPSKYRGMTYEEIHNDPEQALLRKENHRQWMLENCPVRGKHHTEQTRQKMSEKRKAMIATLSDEERKQKLGHNKGKPWTEARRLAQQKRNKK